MPHETLHKYQSVSYGFKIAVVIMLFVFTAIRLSLIAYYPSSEIIPDKVFLLVVLIILFYLWIQELLDFNKLIQMNNDLHQTHEQLKAAEIDTIAALIRAEEAKDLYTRGHSENVRSLALAIAQEMNLGYEKKNIINRAGILHDIGKISISDTILNKVEKLTDPEWAIIKKHPENAFAILEPLKFLISEREIILQHHERYDGKGYPRGLTKEDICFEAMIIAVADAFDAMNTKRAYRDALSKDAILAELHKGRGTQHSPKVIDTFLALLERDPQLWQRQ